MKLGHKIRVGRQIKGYSQEVMADLLGISPTAYAKMERGETKVTEEKLSQIAEVLGIDKEDLRRFDEKMIFKNCNNIVNGHNENQYNNNDFEHERKAYLQTIALLTAQNEQQQAFITQLLAQLAALQSAK
jgi:transcriptional regulator with XRE-family HTH domain